MAKKAGTKRVHQIAKELGVASKDVVNKCISEGIPSVSNHMSTLSAGLAATIREWFNEGGESGSAVQVAAPVDVTKARAKAKKKVRKKSPSKAKQKDEDTAPDPQEELARSGLGEMQNGRLQEDEGQEVEVEKRATSHLKEVVPDESDQREDKEEIERDIKPPGEEPQEGKRLTGQRGRKGVIIFGR